MPVTRIVLDASGWTTPGDFYAAFLPAVGAPEWHGPNLDALFDGLVARLYAIPAPSVVVERSAALPSDLRAYLARIARVFDDARRDAATTASITFT